MTHDSRLHVLALAATVALAGGCVSRSPAVGSETRGPGRVFLMRGIVNVPSFGMDALAARLRDRDVDARVCPWMSYRDLADYLIRSYREGDREPICIVGHSQGVDHAVFAMRELQKHDIPVELLVSIDEWFVHGVPTNVRRVVTIHKRDSSLHFADMDRARGGEVTWRDVDLRKNRTSPMPGLAYHFLIDRDPEVHRVIIQEVLRVCHARSEAGPPSHADGDGRRR